MTSVLITGIAGMIGSHVAEECLRRDWDVTGVDNFQSGRPEYVPAGCKLVVNDAQDFRALVGYDYVFHLAALPFIPDSYSDRREFYNTNTLGTVKFLECLDHSTRIVVISSSEVYGSAQFTPMTEVHPLNPQSSYAVSKLAAERAALALHWERKLPIIIFRPFNSYGPRCCQPYLIADVMAQLIRQDGNVFLGNMDSKRDFTFVTDTAKAIVETAVHGEPGEAYHFGSGKARSVESIVDDLAAICFDGAIKIHSDQKERMRPNDVKHLEATSVKFWGIASERWELVSWLEGLRRTYQWFHKIGRRWPWES